MRERLNTQCEWTLDPPRPLQLSVPADRQHLWDDAALAEDLAIRYADARRGHGGPGYAGLRDECMTRLVDRVARAHAVTANDMRQAVGHRSASFDAAVMLSFAVVYVWLARAAVRWIVDRFGDSRRAVVTMVLVAAVPIAVAGVVLGGLWSSIAEIVRVGNQHLSFRTGRTPWSHHPAALFASAVFVFAVVAARRLRARIAAP